MSKLFIWVRHCNFSEVSMHKSRPAWFDRRRFFSKLVTDCNNANIPLTIIFDGEPQKHFVSDFKNVTIETLNKCSDPWSFRFLLDSATSNSQCQLNDILYFCEDDYFHRPGWIEALRDGFASTDADYVSLYDHPDKYTSYPDLKSQIFKGKACYWRTVPSTTHTFAVKLKTLLEDKETHIKYSDVSTNVNRDHQRFLHLGALGRKLVTAMPGFSTHVESNQLCPFIDWQKELAQFKPGSPACGTNFILDSELSHS